MYVDVHTLPYFTEHVLRDAANLIQRSGWTTKAFCRDKSGDPVSTDSSEYGCSYCASGAIMKAGLAYNLQQCDCQVIVNYVNNFHDDASLPAYNDHQTSSAPVVELLFRAADAYRNFDK